MSRAAVASVVLALVAVLAAMVLVVSAPSAQARVVPGRPCGLVARFTEVYGAHVTCSTAKKVGRRVLHGQKRPLGFRCRKVAINAGAGWYTRCSKGRAIVAVVPE